MKKVTNLVSLIALVAMSFTMTSCFRKPYQEQKYEEILPNETAFVIPLETGNQDAQTKLKSEDYLEQRKVASKRIYITTQWHQTGRWETDGEWIPSIKIIKVDRTPVTREWTQVGSGTNEIKKEELEVESKESIGFRVGITATASIPEEWATKFLYNYNTRTLSQVMDNDVRGFIQNILTTEFGIRTLSECQNQRKDIYDNMRKRVTDHFATLGVRIMNVGAAGQFGYIDQTIQDAINNKFTSEMKVTEAANAVKAANNFAQAKNAITDQKQLDADINIKNAIADGIRSGKIPVPTTMCGNMSILDLYALKGISAQGSGKSK